MLDFEKELEHYKPCPDVEDVEDLVQEADTVDMPDLIRQMIEEVNNGGLS